MGPKGKSRGLLVAVIDSCFVEVSEHKSTLFLFIFFVFRWLCDDSDGDETQRFGSHSRRP